MSFTYKHPRAALTVDCVVFALNDRDLNDRDLNVLLIQRNGPPFAGCWALPGGFVELDETLAHAASRELREETGLDSIRLEQLCAIGDVDRDPRERVVTIAYHALVRMSEQQAQAASDARAVAWFAVNDLPNLAFDHNKILSLAYQRLRDKVRYQPIGLELLPERFTLRHLQHLYEAVLDRPLDKRDFRRKILSMGLLVEVDEIKTDVACREARLYRFDKAKYARLLKRGFTFEM